MTVKESSINGTGSYLEILVFIPKNQMNAAHAKILTWNREIKKRKKPLVRYWNKQKYVKTIEMISLITNEEKTKIISSH